MLTETEVRNAVTTGAILKDHDGETGQAVEVATDGETFAVRLVAQNFERWTDSLDLTYAVVNTCPCVHCKPFLDKPHGNGCLGYHCKGTCVWLS